MIRNNRFDDSPRDGELPPARHPIEFPFGHVYADYWDYYRNDENSEEWNSSKEFLDVPTPAEVSAAFKIPTEKMPMPVPAAAASERRVAPLPYVVHPLNGSQYHYQGHTACAMVAILFAHYLLKSISREEDPMQSWMKIGCWIYLGKAPEIAAKQSQNKNFAKGYLTPRLARELTRTTSVGLRYVEEISGVFYDCAPASEAEDASAGLSAFIKEGVFVSLSHALRRMFFMALEEPVAGTLVPSFISTIHAIGIRWRNRISAQERERWKRELCPEGDPDRYDGKESPLLEELDEKINVGGFFLVDFLDSHLNDWKTGMEGCDRRSSGAVWIEFKSLCGLRDFLMSRYPSRSRPDSRAEDVMQAMPDTFDLVLWKASSEPTDHTETDDIVHSDAFNDWFRGCEASEAFRQ